jgi:hypothetical protein
MTSFRILAVSLSWAVLASPLLRAGDLSRYRSFQIGTDLATIAGQTRMDPSQAKVIHRRPALIQELEWRPQPLGPSTQVESVEKVIFSFDNDQLYRIAIDYDQHKTEGLTAEDLSEAISATCGTATRVNTEIILPSIYADNETVEVIAQWDDLKYSFNLIHSPNQASFTLVVLSKRLDALARTAGAEAIRLDAQEAPQREVELQKKQEEESRAQQEKARLTNKAGFRP